MVLEATCLGRIGELLGPPGFSTEMNNNKAGPNHQRRDDGAGLASLRRNRLARKHLLSHPALNIIHQLLLFSITVRHWISAHGWAAQRQR